MCRWSGDDCLQVTHFEDRAADAPAWSPDGRFLAFEVRDSMQSDLFVADVFEGAPRPVTLDLRNDRLPVWSPDGKALYFTSDRSGGWEVWKKPLGGGPSIRITRDGGFAVRPAADDQSLYYTKYGQPGLWVREKEGGEERLLTADLAARDWGNWALNDAGLYYLDRRPDASPFLMHLDPATGEVREVLQATAGWVPDQRGLAVAPDGSWILFAQTERTVTDITEAAVPLD
jgi:Tol biopolymer transport system component